MVGSFSTSTFIYLFFFWVHELDDSDDGRGQDGRGFLSLTHIYSQLSFFLFRLLFYMHICMYYHPFLHLDNIEEPAIVGSLFFASSKEIGNFTIKA